MSTLRRHRRWFGALGALLVGGLIFLGWPTPPRSEAATLRADGYGVIDALTADEITTLRRDAGLDDDTLACLDAAALTLENLLAALRTWHETNRPEWITARAAVADAQALIRSHLAAIQNGIDRSAELATARQQLAQAQAAYDTLIDDLRADTVGSLDEGLAAIANHVRARSGVAMPYRALDLNAQQDADLAAALRRYRERRTFTHNPELRDTLQQAFHQERDSALGNENLLALANLLASLPDSSARVTHALNTVFPTENEPQG